MKDKNLLIALVASFLIGVLTIPTINNLPLPEALVNLGTGSVAFILGFVTLIGYLFSKWLGRFISIFDQIGRFAVVGILNTVLDFAVLNLLINLSGTSAGPLANTFKGISFVVAVVNSYYWNKHWTFEFKQHIEREFMQFLVVSLVGFGLNVGAFHVVVNMLGPVGGINPQAWANVGALAGTLTGLAWNFVGYKFLVFRKEQNS